VVWESLVAIDFIDRISGATGKDRLVSEDPYLAAQSRIWADKVNRDCCSPYYGVLVRKEDHERREHFDKLLSGLKVRSYRRNRTQVSIEAGTASRAMQFLISVPCTL
jgi:glutathione S-transferase